MTALLLLALAFLAGCNDPGDGGDDGMEGDGGPTPTGSEDAGEVPDPTQGFAVLVASGRLEGEAQDPASCTDSDPCSVVACSIVAPDGEIDLEAKQAWAKPGEHAFKVGQTWLLVLDEVEVEDPRSTGCFVRTVTPFTATGNWQPQVGDGAFSLDISPDGERLLVSRNPVEPGGSFETYAEFEDGDYTFKGDLTFTHAGWWPPSAFEEREEGAPADGRAVWWD